MGKTIKYILITAFMLFSCVSHHRPDTIINTQLTPDILQWIGWRASYHMGYNVDVVLHFSPYQASSIMSVGSSNDILSIDYQTIHDPVISIISAGDIKGADVRIRKEPQSESIMFYHRESIDSDDSWNDIEEYIQSFKEHLVK